MKTLCLLVFGVLLVVPSFGEETYTDGNHLQTYCAGAADTFGGGYCVGIVSGVSNTSTLVCPPIGVTRGQEIKVVQKFLADNPEKLQLRNTTLVEAALAKAFPCPLTTPPK
ncbi:MAG: hypothetical protein M3O09_10910 [Acidobacteriota bacterium]|nr:hypothetical protein [Acidobacteriota bacterium]